MTTPRPKLDLFNDSPCLLSKKCRSSTPSLRPPKPPTKSTKNIRRQRGYYEHNRSFNDRSFDPTANFFDNNSSFSNLHDGSFSFGLNDDNSMNNNVKLLQNVNQYCRLYRQFEIISKIGSGDFADVYQAKSLIDGQYYAIKRTSIPFTSQSDRLRKLQEVRNHQLLPPHPNCVRYYDSWEEDGFLYIQTELCKTSLNEIIETSEEHKLPEHIVWNYLLDLLLAIKHLHDHDLIHMDIKPDNIFISFDGIAKLGDFGLMCSCLDLNSSTISNISTMPTSKATTNNNNANSMISTTRLINNLHHDNDDDDDIVFDSSSFNHQLPNDHDDSGIINRSDESIDSIDEGDSKYLASETMQGKFTKAADIFSLGITIFEVASGLDLPKRGEVYHKLRHNEIEDLYFNGLSPELVRVIKMMMEEDYTKRPTVDNLLQLEAVQSRRLIIIS